VSPTKDSVVGASVDVVGTLSAPYGQLEIRNVTALTLGQELLPPMPWSVALADLGEGTEGSFVEIAGTVSSVQVDGDRITIVIGDGTSSVRALADPASGVTRTDVARGDVVLARGIVGQHATATGKLDGYRLWLRGRSDLEISAPVATAAPVKTSAPTATTVTGGLAQLRTTRGAAVDVDATVTATAGLLDLSGPTIVVDDGTAAVAVILPDGAVVPPVGMRVHVIGKVSTWETGPTVLATSVVALGETQSVDIVALSSGIDSSNEWQLVRLCGRVLRYVSSGSRWRVDIQLGEAEISVLGEPAAGIQVDKTAVGRLVVATGIVRRSTSDKSVFQVLPRTQADFRLGPAPAVPNAGSVVPGVVGSSAGDATASSGALVAISALGSYVDRTATIAGLVVDNTAGIATLSDGSGDARLGGRDAADAIAMLQVGDAIEVSGVVESDATGLILAVDPESIVDMPGVEMEAPSHAAGSISAGALAETAGRAATVRGSLRQTATRVDDGGPLAVAAVALLGLLVVVFLAGLAVVRRRRLGPP
jgi:hypothetical protein